MISDPTSPTTIQDRHVERPTATRFKNLWIGLTSLVVIILAIGTFLMISRASTAQHAVSTPATSSKAGAQHRAASQNTTAAHGAALAVQAVTLKGTTPDMMAVANPDALALIKQYYTDINAKNYQDAYNIWGSQYQHGTSYDAFAKGFANTQKVDLAEGAITGGQDGSVSVAVTITATDQVSGQAVTNVYQGYYDVGLENGNAKLVGAQLLPTSSSNARI